MGNRIESVTLKLVDEMSSGLAHAAARVGALRAEVEGLNGAGGGVRGLEGDLNRLGTTSRRTSTDLDRLGTSMSRSSTGVSAFRREARQAGSEIDTFSGRLGVMATTVASLGPALVPIASGLVPAVAGLATGMAAAGGAAAAAGLAFAGVGDALKALNAYQLDPTAANLAKLNQAMHALGPAGENFVHFLDSLGGSLEELQRTAGANLFPGLEAGLTEVMTLLPEAKSLIGDLASRLGSLSFEAGKALAGPEWESFFDFIRENAGPTLDEFAHATGNVVTGFANLTVAFGPLGTQFTAGLLHASEAFRSWTESGKGFDRFAAAASKNAGELADFLGAVGNASVQLVQAVAPWGSVVLPALTSLANLAGAIAGSPLGPPLATAALAMTAFSRASSLVSPAIGKVKTSVGSLGRDLNTVTFGWARANQSMEEHAAASAAASQRLREVGSTAAKTAGSVGLLIAASSNVTKSWGLQNAAMDASIGLMAGGGLGAAIGATVGLLQDYKASMDAVSEASKGFSATLDQQTGALTENSKSWVLDQITDKQKVALERAGLDLDTVTKKVAQGGKAWVDYRNSFGLAGQEKGKLFRNDAEDAAAALDTIAEGASQSKAATEALGRTTFQSVGAFEAAQAGMGGMGGAAAVAATDIDKLTAAQNAQHQASLAAIDAGTAYGQALDNLGKQAAKGTKGFSAFTEAGRANREALSQFAGAYNAQSDAVKNSVGNYNKAKASIAKFGAEMGLTKGQVRQLQAALDKPAELRVKDTQAQNAIHDTQAAFKKLKPKVQTEILTSGVPRTMAQVDALVAKYHLTEKERKALITLKDAASSGIRNILGLLAGVRDKSITITTTRRFITIDQVVRNPSLAKPGLSQDPNKRARGGFQENGHLAFADGGYGTDGRYYSRTPQIIPGGANILWGEKETGWEAYISGKPGERDRNLQILSLAADRLGATVTAYASGGTAGQVIAGTARHSTSLAPLIERLPIAQLARLGKVADDLSHTRLGRLSKALDAASKAEKKAADAAKSRYDSLKDQRASYTESIQTGLRGDLWANSGSGGAFSSASAAGSPAAVTAQLRQQTAQAKQFSKDIATLKKKGISGAALAEIISSGDYQRAHTFALATTAQDKAYAQAYNARQSATAAAAKTGGIDLTPGLNAALAAYHHDAKQLAQINKELADVKKLLASNHKEAQHSRKQNGAGSAAAKGRRDTR